MRNKITIVTIIIILISSTAVYGGVLDFDFYGLSYHFDEEEAYRGAPMKLDNNGVWVYNPGIGFGYDFRENIEKGGFSPITRIAFFQDCASESFIFGGAGMRYRKFLPKNMTFEINLLGVLACAKEWDYDQYNLTALPIINFGFGHKFKKHLISLLISYVPENSSISGTSGSDLLFFHVSISVNRGFNKDINITPLITKSKNLRYFI